MSSDTILPHNATPFELALEDVLARAPDVPFDQIRDPATAPVDFLPFLAAHHGVRLWHDDWPEERKRAVIAAHAGTDPNHPGRRLASLVGTRLGLVEYLGFVDAEILDAQSHPAPFVVGETPVKTHRVNLPAFTGDYLVRVQLDEPAAPFIVGYTPVADGAVSAVSDEPLSRALGAFRAAKSAGHSALCFFDTRTPITTLDAPSTADAVMTGSYRDRMELSG